MRPFAINTTGTPNWAAAAATESPPEPAPMTQRSGFSTSSIAAFPPYASDGAAPEPLHCNRDQRHDTQRRQPRNQLRCQQRSRIEVERTRVLAFGPHLGKAGLVCCLLRLDRTIETFTGQRIGKGSWDNA